MEEECGPPRWFYKTGTHPPTDNAYFENMTRVIFQAGLSWRLIERKWPNFQKTFENFSVDRVARFGDDDVERLMADKGHCQKPKKDFSHDLQRKTNPNNKEGNRVIPILHQHT